MQFKELDIVDVLDKNGKIFQKGWYVSHLANNNGDYFLSDGCVFWVANEKYLKLTKTNNQ